MPDETQGTTGRYPGITVPDEDPPYGVAAMNFVAGSAVLIGLILLLLGLLGDCLESLLAALGVALVAVGIVGWFWSRASFARRRRQLERLRREIEEWAAAQQRK